ncbi:MAG: hypothetical protein JST44_19435 [Cyanobacteria bacterium SZAS LIN-5]|nr:hypothetical protein [Cyanobacteria bacterium SZAS LIN-5]
MKLKTANQLNDFEMQQEESGGGIQRTASGAPELSIREWYEGTKYIIRDRSSYKHRIEMMILVGAEPILDFGV